MSEVQRLGLQLVDGLDLDEALRAALRPGELVRDENGEVRQLPRFFYEIGSRDKANEVEVAPAFRLLELLRTDVREAAVLQGYPRYAPCAIIALAAHLAVLRTHLGRSIYIAANGGYRSPAHALTRGASLHCWGTAVNIYRVGDDLLDSQETIERYADEVRAVLPGVWIRPYGHAEGFADDHLHFDLGYSVVIPRGAAGLEEGTGELEHQI